MKVESEMKFKVEQALEIDLRKYVDKRVRIAMEQVWGPVGQQIIPVMDQVYRQVEQQLAAAGDDD